MLTQIGLFHFGLPVSGLANQSPCPRLYSAAWPYISRDRIPECLRRRQSLPPQFTIARGKFGVRPVGRDVYCAACKLRLTWASVVAQVVGRVMHDELLWPLCRATAAILQM
jgi:hypothetical protein